jgi:hypothetical protein
MYNCHLLYIYVYIIIKAIVLKYFEIMEAENDFYY